MLQPAHESIDRLCRKAEAALAPTVVRIRYTADYDNRAEPDAATIFFRIVLDDKTVAKTPIRKLTERIEHTIEGLLEPATELNVNGFVWLISIQCYWNYRTLAEANRMKEKDWE